MNSSAHLDLWALAGARAKEVALGGAILRLVESQAQVATNRLVDTLDEQALLETLLESSKPPLVAGTERLHYLLATPFRYPPLRHGSRFGGRFEPSLFYGARKATTVLAEAAYYRLVFLHGMAQPPATPLRTQHTLFSATIRCSRGLRLQAAPFDAWFDTITDPTDYTATQALGGAMRAAGIAAFEYPSTRDRAHGINLALLTPAALASTRPTQTQPWLAETTPAGVNFYSTEHGEVHRFARADFEIDGRLPAPAM